VLSVRRKEMARFSYAMFTRSHVWLCFCDPFSFAHLLNGRCLRPSPTLLFRFSLPLFCFFRIDMFLIAFGLVMIGDLSRCHTPRRIRYDLSCLHSEPLHRILRIASLCSLLVFTVIPLRSSSPLSSLLFPLAYFTASVFSVFLLLSYYLSSFSVESVFPFLTRTLHPPNCQTDTIYGSYACIIKTVGDTSYLMFSPFSTPV
jgi:hypothetical protein